MKKLLSIILSLVMAMSVIIIPTSVSAKQTKKKPNTYPVGIGSENKVEGLYIPSKRGTIYTYDNKYKNLYFKNLFLKTNKKTITLDKCQRGDEGNDRDILEYYVRGDKVYYLFMKERKNDYLYQVKTVNLNGKNKKTLFSVSSTDHLFKILGGYGSGVIFHEHKYNKKKGKYLNTVKMFRYKKIKTLFKFYSYGTNSKIKIFDGKVFFNNKVYNIDTGKTTSFATKENHVTKNYMYYINKNNNLKSLDKNGVRRIVTKNVYSYYCANDSSTVVYSKLNSNKEEVFYQRTGTGKEYKLCSENDIKNLTLKHDKDRSSVISTMIFNNKVYFVTNELKPEEELNYYNDTIICSRIVTSDIKGGNLKVYYESPYQYGIDIWIFNNSFKYDTWDAYYFDEDSIYD